MSTKAYGQRVRVRLFLEGVEVPVIAATVQASPNAPSMASIQIPPLPEATRLLPRTLVHLFFFDSYEAASPFVTNTGVDADTLGNQDPSAYEKLRSEYLEELGGYPDFEDDLRQNAENRRYKLLFVGEVVGFQWTKSPYNRSVVLKCEDLSNYWDYAYLIGGGGLFGGPTIKELFSGGRTNLQVDLLFGSKASTITDIITAGTCNTYPELGGLAAGIIRLLELVGGSYIKLKGSKSSRTAGQNLFFSTAELRLRITQQIAALDNDRTSSQLLRQGGYSWMFQRAIGSMGHQSSLRKVLQAITKVMFHEMYPQPAPYFIPGTDGEVTGTKRMRIRDHAQWGNLYTLASSAAQSLEEMAVSVRGQDDNTSSSQKDYLLTIRRLADLFRTGINSSFRAPGPLKGYFTQCLQKLQPLQVAIRKWRPNPPETLLVRIQSVIEDILSILSKITTYQVDVTSREVTSPARLNQQIFRPDIWFTAPPRCNVIFPEQYMSLTFERNFLQEPTRYLLRTPHTWFPEEPSFDSFYFAPSAGNKTGDARSLLKQNQGSLLEHEVFTGILPIFEKMGEFKIFSAKRLKTDGDKSSKTSLAQRSANFVYFKHRFNARKLQIRGRFNPYVAVGFPGLIIDSPMGRQAIVTYNRIMRATNGLPDKQASDLVGTSFLGSFTQVQHTVSQQAGQGETTILCSYPRQVEETVQFLGGVPEAIRVKRREDEPARRSTDVAAVSAPNVGSIGPNQGRIVAVQDITDEVYPPADREFNDSLRGGGGVYAPSLPLYDLGDPSAGRTNFLLVPIATPITGERTASQRVSRIAGSSSREISFRAYKILEEVPTFRLEDTLIPPEEFIRPGWYGDVWSPPKVGEAYRKFFGIGSITDPQAVLSPQGAAFSQVEEELSQAYEEASDAVSAEDARLKAPPLLSIEKGTTIQQAVEFLTLVYSHMRLENMDVDEFIRSYTWRPSATMLDMFGSTDLTWSFDGSTAETGVEGFHSRAFGPHDDLFGLSTPDVETVLGVPRGTPTAQFLDRRKEKREAVEAYRNAIEGIRAFVG